MRDSPLQAQMQILLLPHTLTRTNFLLLLLDNILRQTCLYCTGTCKCKSCRFMRVYATKHCVFPWETSAFNTVNVSTFSWFLVDYVNSLSPWWTRFHHEFFILLASEWKTTPSPALCHVIDFCAPTHTHICTYAPWQTLRKRKKEKNELLILPSNYGVGPRERYDLGEITSNSHLSQQIEWKTQRRGKEKGMETREKKRGQKRSSSKD